MKRKADKYTGLFWIKLKASVQYRFAFVTGICQALMQIAIQYAIWTQVFHSRITIGGFDRADMFTYLLVSQGLLMVFAFRNAPERMISQKIRQGDIALELIRPVHFTTARLFENMGDSVVNVSLALGLTGVCSVFSAEFIFPQYARTIALFLISALLSWLLMFHLSVMAGYLTFFTMNFWGIYNAKKAVVDFLSGALVPIAFFPEKLQKLFGFMPFQNIVYTPTMIFLEKYDVRECREWLCIQFCWLVVLAILNEVIYKAAVRRISVNGG